MMSFKYIMRDTMRLLTRHWGLSLLTLVTAVSLFFLLASSALFSLNVRHFVSEVEDDLVISVFIKEGEDASNLVANLQDVDFIKDIRVIPPEKGLEQLKAKIGSQARAVTLLGENPLPWSVEIQVTRSAFINPLVRDLLSFPDVEDVVYAGHLAEKLTKVSAVLNRLSLSVLMLAIIITALVLYNTVKIALYTREKEIGIMLLVGATQTYIALPFVLQGMLLGTLGSLLAVSMIAGAYPSVIEIIKSTLPFIQVIDDPVLLLRFYVILVGTGMTLGWLSSWFAVHKYIVRACCPD